MKLQMIRRDDLEKQLKWQLYISSRFDDKSKQADYTMAAATAAVVADTFSWLDSMDKHSTNN
jgi:hypothetical protein